jgi:hypothetical protein
MSFSTFSSFLQKLAFQRSKSQLKSLLFISAFGFSAFQLEKLAEKQKQIGPKSRDPNSLQLGTWGHRDVRAQNIQYPYIHIHIHIYIYIYTL